RCPIAARPSARSKRASGGRSQPSPLFSSASKKRSASRPWPALYASAAATNAPGRGRSSPGASPSGVKAGGGGSGPRVTGRPSHFGRGTLSVTSARDSSLIAAVSASPKGGRTAATTQPERATTSAATGLTATAWAAPLPTSTGQG